MLPKDALMLEMEESEELVSSSVSPRTQAGFRSSSSPSSADNNSSGKGRRLTVIFVVISLLAVALLAFWDDDIATWDSIATAHVNGKDPPEENPISAKDPNPTKASQEKIKQEPKASSSSSTSSESSSSSSDDPAVENEPENNDEPKNTNESTHPKNENETDKKKEEPEKTETKEIETKNEDDVTKKTEDENPSENAMTEEEKTNKLIAKWGKWGFWDGGEATRPKEDYCAKFPHRDIGGMDFPESAWQADAVYVNHFLDSAAKFVSRAQEAIYTEYGYGRPLPPNKVHDRLKMFHLEKCDIEKAEGPPEKYSENGDWDGAGWTTRRSFKGLSRRLLHAMMTNDSFTVVLAGDGAAAGHGNHFKQSYIMQFHKIMEPIFARLGVKLITRNIAHDGLGTIQDALGSASIYGDDVDWIIWDSKSTDKDRWAYDMFARQALIGGKRVPVLWGGEFEVFQNLHETADVDVGQFGSGLLGIPETQSEMQAQRMPWATRYMKCAAGHEDLCTAPGNRFQTKCWVDRNDIKPPVKQKEPSVSAYPGFRQHQLIGRILSFTILEALGDAISTWSEVTITGGHPLPDEYWHISDYYKNIRNKLGKLDEDSGHCHELQPSRICSTPMKARTEFTPRANPEETSLLSIIQPAPDGYVPQIEENMLYEGPDVPNPALDIEEGSVDVMEILSNRRRLDESFASSYINNHSEEESNENDSTTQQGHLRRASRRFLDDAIVPGTGWELQDVLPGNCDGTYSGICGRTQTDECLLLGHMDNRGGVIGNELSGWLVMNLKDVKAGIVIIKLETRHLPEESKRTIASSNESKNDDPPKIKDEKELEKPQQEESNKETQDTETEDTQREKKDETDKTEGTPEDKIEDTQKENEGENDTEDPKRDLKEVPELPDTFEFDYAINGRITTLDKEQFLKNKHILQPDVELLTVLDDPEMKPQENVQLAIRMRGCGRLCTFKLSHVYWG
mmetsp:Transcript_24884/g.45064  ORF Transcript_24884/g.45064 Transcript_24884/m.45064 type:complete len:965 (-) Transcript_24884:82-2976(-)